MANWREAEGEVVVGLSNFWRPFPWNVSGAGTPGDGVDNILLMSGDNLILLSGPNDVLLRLGD